MSAQQGTVVGGRVFRISTSLIIAALVGVFALSAAAMLGQRSTSETRLVLNPAHLATSGPAIRERHVALGRLESAFALNPAHLATSGAVIRERHEALGRLGEAPFTREP